MGLLRRISEFRLNVNFQFNLSPFCSVFQSEMFAIQEASEYVFNVAECIDTSFIKIISDSQAALKAISTFKCKKELVLNTRKKIISSPIRIILEWVKSHDSDIFNNYVDNLAKQACLLNSSSFDRCPFSFTKSEIEKTITRAYFDNYSKKSFSYLSDKFFVQPDTVVNLYRIEFEPKLIHFLSGKGNFSKYLSTIKKKDSPLCNACGLQEGTSIHVIFSCSCVNNARMILTSNLQNHLITCPTTLDTLIQKEYIQFFVDFIKHTGYSKTPGNVKF